jgi:hypothetical protein
MLEGQTTIRVVDGYATTYALAQDAIAKRTAWPRWPKPKPAARAARLRCRGAAGRLLAPLDHEDPAHCYVTGTGLTHLGSADTRDAMHKKIGGDVETLSDSMKMFRMGVEGGKPAAGAAGVQPEWFYKGDGSIVRASGQALPMPDFALDGGEEPEIAGLYVIGDDGQPYRLGYAIGNEFSDHVTERQNYLYLAHSKLRVCGLGPALLVGELPAHVAGTSRIIGATARCAGKRPLSAASRTCRTPSPTWNTTTSSTACSSARATCTSTSSAPPPELRRQHQRAAGETFEIEAPAVRPGPAQHAGGRSKPKVHQSERLMSDYRRSPDRRRRRQGRGGSFQGLEPGQGASTRAGLPHGRRGADRPRLPPGRRGLRHLPRHQRRARAPSSKPSPSRSWPSATLIERAMAEPACRARASKASVAAPSASCAVRRRCCAKARGPMPAHRQRAAGAHALPRPDLRYAPDRRRPGRRVRGIVTSRWPSRWPAATPPPPSRPAARWC